MSLKDLYEWARTRGFNKIAIDPRVSFGRPVVVSRGVSIAAIVGRIDAGELIADISADYDLSQEDEDIEHAVMYERTA